MSFAFTSRSCASYTKVPNRANVKGKPFARSKTGKLCRKRQNEEYEACGDMDICDLGATKGMDFNMIPSNTTAWGMSKSCIRELAAYGAKRREEIGAKNVYDFSLGNPNIPAPACVNEAIRDLLQIDSVALHGYTPAAGLMSLRRAIADYRNGQFGEKTDAENIFVTCGAAAGLAITMKALLNPGEEVVTIAPFFPEYRVFVEGAGGKLTVVPAREEDFQIDFEKLSSVINENTKAVLINSPNNPSGVVLGEDCIRKLSDLLRSFGERYGKNIYLVCDEPYRELVYGDVEVPCMTRFYDDTIVCYSYSKSLSIPGERLGYVAVCEKMADRETVFASIAGAARALGYVNPPSLIQRVVERCMGKTSDVSKYAENRDLIYNGLVELGFSCVKPDGAFYLFVKSPEPDAKRFSENAKKYELLLVPADDFGCPGYVRVAYCVSRDTIVDSMGAFKKLARDYGLS